MSERRSPSPRRSWSETTEHLRASGHVLSQRVHHDLSDYMPIIDETLARLRDALPILISAEKAQTTRSGRSVAELSAWAFGRLSNALQLAIEGYLVDAMILTRAAHEALLQLIVFDVEEDEEGSPAGRWLDGAFIAPREIRDYFASYSEQFRLAPLYKSLSDLSHPASRRSILLQADIEDNDQAKVVKFGLGGVYRPKDLRTAVHFIWYQSLVLLGYLPMAMPQAPLLTDTGSFVEKALVKCDELIPTTSA